eukprot:540555_1
MAQCPGWHGLKRFSTTHRGYTCDVCSKKMSLYQEMWGCRTCNYDLCRSCYNNKGYSTSSSNKKGSTSKLDSLFKKSYGDKEDPDIMSEDACHKMSSDDSKIQDDLFTWLQTNKLTKISDSLKDNDIESLEDITETLETMEDITTLVEEMKLKTILRKKFIKAVMKLNNITEPSQVPQPGANPHVHVEEKEEKKEHEPEGPNKKQKITCHRCGKIGHFRKECRSTKNIQGN